MTNVTMPLKRFPSIAERMEIGDGLRVSPLCLGAVGAPEVVEEAFDAGINFFFLTADMHWPLYESLRVGLRSLLERRPSVRDELVVAAVSYVTQREFCHAPFMEVIEAVPGLERLDVSVIGGAYSVDFAARREEYARHRLGGIPGIRASGASFHDREQAGRAQRERQVDIAYVRYNTVHRGAETDVFPAASVGGPPVYVFKSTFGCLSAELMLQLGLTGEHWLPRFEDHHRYVLGATGVAGLLCAPLSLDHLRRTLVALEAGPLTEEEIQYMNDLGDVAGGRAVVGEE